MNRVHDLSCSMVDNNTVCDSGIDNKNRIILTEADEMVDDCRYVDMSFRESDGMVVEEMCDLISGD